MITAQVVLINKEGLALGVSRKDNHNDFGLPGGKMELEDNMDPLNYMGPMRTAIRECKEETGLDIHNLRLIFAIHKSGNMGYTYLADYSGEINHIEPHLVKWVPFQVLMNGSFGRYNQMVSESLTDMGLDYKIDIDVEALKAELNEFMSENRFGYFTVSVDELRKERNWDGKIFYRLYLKPVGEESCDEDEKFIQGIEAIGLQYGVEVRIPSYYYHK